MGENAQGQDLWREATAAVEALMAVIRQTRQAGQPSERPGTAAAFVTEAYLIWLSAGLRCASELAGHLQDHHADLARFVLDDLDRQPAPERQATLQSVHELVSEIGETTVREANRLRAELEGLGESLTQLAAHPAG